MTHTPAPWKARRTTAESVVITGFEPKYATRYSMGCIRIAEVFEDTTDESNTRLITAAPLLLAELEKVKTELAHLYHNGQIKANAPERERIQIMIVNAEYAIEKAKG